MNLLLSLYTLMKKEEQWQILKKQLSYLNLTAKIPQPQHSNLKNSLTKCIAQSINFSMEILHEKICNHLEKLLSQSKLPRRLSYIYKDCTIVDDYKKDPDLASFSRITREIVSIILQRKVVVYWIGVDKFVNCEIINEGCYPQCSQILLGKLGNSYCQVIETSVGEVPYFNQQNSQEQLKLHDLFKSQTQIDLKDQLPKVQRIPHIKSTHSGKRTKSIVSEKDKRSIEMMSSNVQNQPPYHHFSPTHNYYHPQEIQAFHLIESCNQDNTPRNIPKTISNNNNNLINLHPSPSYMQMSGFYPYQSIYYPNQINTNINPSYFKQQPPVRSTGFINIDYDGNSHHPQTSHSPSPPRKTPLLTRTESAVDDKERFTGRLKFFDEGKNYGFIIMDADESDIFVHYDDLHKAGIANQKIKSYKQNEGLIRFSFKVMQYYGKYNKSRKAVDLIILHDQLLPLNAQVV